MLLNAIPGIFSLVLLLKCNFHYYHCNMHYCMNTHWTEKCFILVFSLFFTFAITDLRLQINGFTLLPPSGSGPFQCSDDAGSIPSRTCCWCLQSSRGTLYPQWRSQWFDACRHRGKVTSWSGPVEKWGPAATNGLCKDSDGQRGAAQHIKVGPQHHKPHHGNVLLTYKWPQHRWWNYVGSKGSFHIFHLHM